MNKLKQTYCPVESNDDGLVTLVIFLTDGITINRYLDWLQSPEEHGIGSNICVLRKIDGCIEISLDLNLFETEDSIRLSIEDFTHVLNRWKKLYNDKWPKIIIKQDDTGVHLEGKDEQEEA